MKTEKFETDPTRIIPDNDISNNNKMCLKCKKKKTYSDFYKNPNWRAQQGYDSWCKECAQGDGSKNAAKEFYWYNNRKWSEELWNKFYTQAESVAINKDIYIKSTPAKQKQMLERLASGKIVRNATEREFESHEVDGFIPKYESDDAAQAREANAKVFSDEFNGWFTKEDIEILEEKYSKIEEDFALDNESIRDYARKVCKASLLADKALADYAEGKISFADVKAAMDLFDTLSKSANFAACKRKAGENVSGTSWSETTLKLETTGHTMQRQIEYEEDVIDRLIMNQAHLAEALGLDNV